MLNNRLLLLKCIVLGSFSFPTPFLILFYVMNITPALNSLEDRFFVVMFLILSGGVLGTLFFYKDSAIDALKDWFPSAKR